MPQVPGLTPTASPNVGATPEISMPVPTDAFGGAVGHALEGLGQQIEKSSDQIWQRAMDMQNLQNETSAKEADAKYMMESGKLHAEFINKEGQNAGPEALAKHIEDLQNLRTGIRKGLNPMAAKMYDASSLSFMGRNIFNASGHSGQQMKVAANNAATARIDTVSNNIGANPSDDVGFQRGIRTIQSEVDRQADLGGWTPEQRAATKENQVSQAVAKRITGLARTDAIGAKSMYDRAASSGALSAVDAAKVEATVQTQFRQQGSRIISDKVLADRRAGDEDDRTEQDYIAAGEKEAEETAKRLGIEDPLFKDFVRDRIRTDYRGVKSAERDSVWYARQTVSGAMMVTNGEGVLPRSVDELKAINPEVATAWDRLPPTVQRTYMRQLGENALGKKVVWTDENMRRYQTLKGMSISDPAKFMETDPVAENLPYSARRELVNLQTRMVKQADGDPRVMQAMRQLDGLGVLKSAGIDKKTDPESYYNFVGALQDAIGSYQNENKKLPKSEEIQTMAGRLLQEQVTNKGWLWDSKSALFNVPVPEADIARIKSDPYWAASNQKPSAQQIHNYYVREQYNKLFKGSAGASKSAVVPGTVSSPVSE